MIMKWINTELTSKETYAKEKYVCELYDSKCELYFWNDNTWRVIDNVFECRLEAENLEDAIEETRQWFLKRVERRIEEKCTELNVETIAKYPYTEKMMYKK